MAETRLVIVELAWMMRCKKLVEFVSRTHMHSQSYAVRDAIACKVQEYACPNRQSLGNSHITSLEYVHVMYAICICVVGAVVVVCNVLYLYHRIFVR